MTSFPNTTVERPIQPEAMSRRASLAGLLGLAAVAAPLSLSAAEESPELESVKTLLQKHHEAMSNHDLKAVLALFADKSAVMGTGPGEIWSGKEEISSAYEHFFKGFDKGNHAYEPQFRIGNLGAEMGWAMTSGNMKQTKEGKPSEWPINLSLSVSKQDGEWKIAALHFSTFTSASADAEK